MGDIAFVDRFISLRLRAFERLGSLAFAHKAILAATFAVLTALAAQVRIYTPFSPVPITLQVFTALLAGAFLGRCFGSGSQLMYIAMGLAGLPVFANWRAGHLVLLGPTGGYIIGFVLAAFIVGHVIHSRERARSTPRIVLAMAAGIGIIYLLGAAQLALVLGLDVQKAIVLGVLPFIGLDLLKMAAATGIARGALPGEPPGPKPRVPLDR